MSFALNVYRFSCGLLSLATLSTVCVTTSLYAENLSPTPTTTQSVKRNGLLSFYFQNIDVRSLLQIIAKSSGLNFVISDAVKGNMTLSLKNVTWKEALDTVLNMHGLSAKQAGNLLYISTVEEMTATLSKTMQSEQVLASLEPLKTRLIRLKYTDAESMATLLKGPQGTVLLSSRGQVTIDKRTNSLVVVDTSKNLVSVAQTITRLDIPAKQVLIEASIVNIETAYEEQLGVRFGLSNSKYLSGTFSGANSIANGVGPQNIALDPTKRLNFNLPANALTNGASPASIGLALAKLGSVFIDLELSALESEGRIQIVSKPRVVTSNQQKATIETGEEIPYQEATSSGATSISFKKAVLSLEVTPLITPNDKIILKLKATQDTRGPQLTVIPQQVVGGVSIAAQFGPPTINTQAVESYILLNDKETFVVGGVYTMNQTKTVDRVPFLGKLPGIGGLFRHNGIKDDKTELLIFITPKIIKTNAIHAVNQHYVFKDNGGLG